jgi:hypothetical protein
MRGQCKLPGCLQIVLRSPWLRFGGCHIDENTLFRRRWIVTNQRLVLGSSPFGVVDGLRQPGVNPLKLPRNALVVEVRRSPDRADRRPGEWSSFWLRSAISPGKSLSRKRLGTINAPGFGINAPGFGIHLNEMSPSADLARNVMRLWADEAYRFLG